MMIKRFFILFFVSALIFLLLMLIRIGLSYSDVKKHIHGSLEFTDINDGVRFDIVV